MGLANLLNMRKFSRSLISLLLLLPSVLLPIHGSVGVAPPDCSAAAGTCVRIGMFTLGIPAGTLRGYNEQMLWYQRRAIERGIAINPDPNQPRLPVQFVTAQLPSAGATADQIATAVRTKFFNTTTGAALVDYVIHIPGSLIEGAQRLLEAASIPAIAPQSPFSGLYVCARTEALVNSTKQWPECAGRTGQRRFPHLFSIASSGERYFQEWVGILNLKKGHTVGVVRNTLSLFPTVIDGIRTASSDYDDMNVVADVVIPTPGVNGTLPSETAQAIDILQTAQPDAVALILNDCVPYIRAFAAANYAPKMLGTLLCTDTNNAVILGSSIAYVTGITQWAEGLRGNSYLEDADTQPWTFFPRKQGGVTIGNATSPRQFASLWRELTGNDASQTPNGAEASILAAPEMLEGAIFLARSANPAKVLTQLMQYYQSSFYGLIASDGYGKNVQKSMVITQRDRLLDLYIISPPSSATTDFIYPMPSFSDRVYEQSMQSSGVELGVMALVILACVITAGFVAYLIIHRKRQVFQAAGLPFYVTNGLGCLIAYLAVLTWPVENNLSSCHARHWLWTIGFHAFLDPLLASSWRIARIFSARIRMVKVSNLQLATVSCLLAVPQLIINILLSSITDLGVRVEIGDVDLPRNTSFTVCDMNQTGTILLAITVVYAGALLVAACVLAFQVRKAYALFNDAKPIAASIYLFFLTSTVILAVQLALNTSELSQQRLLFAIRSVGVILAYQGSLSILYLSRMLSDSTSSEVQKLATTTTVPAIHIGVAVRSQISAQSDSDKVAPLVKYQPSPQVSARGSTKPPTTPGNHPLQVPSPESPQ